MKRTEQNIARPSNAVEGSERVVVPDRMPRRLDRAHIAAIVQQIPSECYCLTLLRRDPISGLVTPRRGVIGDVDGLDVLTLIDRDQVLLHLHDIDEVLRHFDIVLPDAPSAAPPRHRLRHGLVLASPGTRFVLRAPTGEGALRLVSGTATLRPNAGDTAEPRVERGVTFVAGAVLPRHRRAAQTIEVGAETLTAVTYEAVPRHGVVAVMAEVSRRAAAIGARLRGSVATPRFDEAPIEFRLSRAKPQSRVPA